MVNPKTAVMSSPVVPTDRCCCTLMACHDLCTMAWPSITINNGFSRANSIGIVSSLTLVIVCNSKGLQGQLHYTMVADGRLTPHGEPD